MQNIDTAIDPFYSMFRQKGWRFDQPMQGKFTIAVPVAQGLAEGIVDWAKEKYHDYQTGRQWNKFGKAQRNGDQAGMQAAQDAAAAHKDQLQAARYRRTGSTLSKDTSTGLGQDVANLKALKAKGLAEDLQADDGKHYDSFDDFISRFDADSFDDTEVHSAGREIRGYINGKCVMSWEFDDESMTSGYGNYDMTMLEDDELQRRIGINSVNKFARPGQTDYSEIPAGNHPRSKHKYSDEYRSSQPERLKHNIKASLGKHAEPNLPESMASMLGRLDELAEADMEEGATMPKTDPAINLDVLDPNAVVNRGLGRSTKEKIKTRLGQNVYGDLNVAAGEPRSRYYADKPNLPEQAMAESVESHAGRLFRELQQFKG
jgi:hypothetical protein